MENSLSALEGAIVRMESASIAQKDDTATGSKWHIIFALESAWLDIFVQKVKAIYFIELYKLNPNLFYHTIFQSTMILCTALWYTESYHTVM